MEPLERMNFVREALEASIFANPDAPGLSFDELIEVGGQFDLRRGELTDLIQSSSAHHQRHPDGVVRLTPTTQTLRHADLAFWRGWYWDPEPRDIAAFDFVHLYFHELGRELGQRNIRAPKVALLAEAESRGLSVHGVKVALAYRLLASHLTEDDGVLQVSFGKAGNFHPPTNETQSATHQTQRRPLLGRLIPTVGDTVARRTDGRPASPEPLQAFEKALEDLGHGEFRLWWQQTRLERQRQDPQRSPATVVVLSAALAEGALALATKRARESGRSMQKHIAADDPRQWKFSDLARAAKSGCDPILSEDLHRASMRLNEARQRIHAGRLLAEPDRYPRPDWRPEQAREAEHTADAVVRAVIDWLQRGELATTQDT